MNSHTKADCGRAEASLVTGTFSGSVDSALFGNENFDTGIVSGTRVEGTYSYDSDTPNVSHTPCYPSYYSGGGSGNPAYIGKVTLSVFGISDTYNLSLAIPEFIVDPSRLSFAFVVPTDGDDIAETPVEEVGIDFYFAENTLVDPNLPSHLPTSVDTSYF